jgi:hypothetical protein
MTFLEWEIYSKAILERDCETMRDTVSEPYLSMLLLDNQRTALENILSIAEHVVERGFLDEDTNKWKIE